MLLFSACSITVTGKISVKGNDPHVFPVLTSSDNTEYIISGTNKKIMMEKYQGKTITVKGLKKDRAKDQYGPAELEVTNILNVR